MLFSHKKEGNSVICNIMPSEISQIEKDRYRVESKKKKKLELMDTGNGLAVVARGRM